MATAAPAETMTINDELCARIDQLGRDHRLLSVGELSRRVDAVRNIAQATGLVPLARLAAGLGQELAREGRGATVRAYTEAMRESIGCQPQDEATARLFLASVGVRLTG